jgi:hypothetical protein
MKLIIYEAILSNPDNIARVQAVRRTIEAAGGKVTLSPPTNVGMVVVTLALPPGDRPDQFLPGLPFYPA